jgi:hypothetical protein
MEAEEGAPKGSGIGWQDAKAGSGKGESKGDAKVICRRLLMRVSPADVYVLAQGDVKASVDLPAGERKAHFLQGLFVLTSIGSVFAGSLRVCHWCAFAGWCLVDNTQDEDWDRVSLTLIGGRYVQQLDDRFRFRVVPVI